MVRRSMFDVCAEECARGDNMKRRVKSFVKLGIMTFLALLGALAGEEARADAPPGRYVVSADMVQDQRTSLTWQRAAAEGYAWASGKAFCEALTLGGFSDWRLPSAIELTSLVDYDRTWPTIDPVAFPNTPSTGSYWSSSPFVRDPEFAWCVNFAYGGLLAEANNKTLFVRCVR